MRENTTDKTSSTGSNLKKKKEKKSMLCSVHLSLIHPFNTAWLTRWSEIFSCTARKFALHCTSLPQQGYWTHRMEIVSWVIYVLKVYLDRFNFPRLQSCNVENKVDGQVYLFCWTHRYFVVFEIKHRSNSPNGPVGNLDNHNFFLLYAMTNKAGSQGIWQNSWVACQLVCR